MATTTNTVVVDIVDVRRHDGPGISLPNDLPLEAVIDVLQRKLAEDNQWVDLAAPVQASPLDGAHALVLAMNEKFGISVQKTVWGSRQSIKVDTDAHGGTLNVPWGQFDVPGIEGTLESGLARDDDGRFIFQVSGHVLGKYRRAFDELVELVKRIVLEHSLYKGKALDLRLTDASGNPERMAKIKFLNTDHAVAPIYNAALADQYQYEVLAYIDQYAMVKRLKGSVKRGILFAGQYGVGKTMAALDIAAHCENAATPFTFVYTKPSDLPAAIDFIRPYLPGLVFVEDMESVAGGERTEDVNRLLNKLDGVDTKGGDLIVVATTNNLEMVTPAMRRPGRIDTVLIVEPPDADAAVRVAKMYSKGRMGEDDYTEAGRLLAGLIPPVIQEAVARASIRASLRTGVELAPITCEDLVQAARVAQSEREAFEHKPDPHPMTLMGDALGTGIGKGLGAHLADLVTTNGHS